MAAGIYNFSIEQGATLRKTFTWTDANGNPVDLTGYTAKMQLKDKAGGIQSLQLDTTNGDITFPTPTNGQIVLYVANDVTSTLTLTKYVYDLDLTAPNGDVIRLLKGRIEVSPAVTV